jgi:hypothetical protein
MSNALNIVINYFVIQMQVQYLMPWKLKILMQNLKF